MVSAYSVEVGNLFLSSDLVSSPKSDGVEYLTGFPLDSVRSSLSPFQLELSVYRLQSTRKEKNTETIISPAHEMKQRPKQPEHYGNELLLITDIRIQSKTCHLSLTFKSIVEGFECVQV